MSKAYKPTMFPDKIADFGMPYMPRKRGRPPKDPEAASRLTTSSSVAALFESVLKPTIKINKKK